jgi:glycosyltransferase involved in cell wall biosynthesis
MSETNTLISVLLPVYNGGEYLKLAVNSVLEQDLEDFEFLILDDCSSDGSYEWLQELQDSRITLSRNETNRGLFYNLNLLIKKSDSPLIKLWAQDDIMYPNCLAGFVAFHQQHPQIGFSYCGRDVIDENGKIKENNGVDHTPEIINRVLHTGIAYFTGSIAGNIANTCISKKALDKVGVFNENMKISADFDMWVRLAEHYDTGFIRQKLIQLRDHEGQLSRNEKYYINHVREDLEVYHKLVFYYTLMVKAVLKADLKTAAAYARQLSAIDNFVLLTAAFVKAKIQKPPLPAFLSELEHTTVKNE